MIFSPLSLSSPPFSAVGCDFRWNSPDPSKRNGATNGFSSTASGKVFLPDSLEGFLLMRCKIGLDARAQCFPGQRDIQNTHHGDARAHHDNVPIGVGAIVGRREP